MTDEDDEPKRSFEEEEAEFFGRACAACGEPIPVGKDKVGRTVFKGGICYRCWLRQGKPGRAKK